MTMKLFVVLMWLAVAAFAQNAKPTSFAEITGDAATHQLATSGLCRTVQFVVPSTNTAVVRIGDSTTTVSKGLTLAAGAGLFLPPLTLDTRQGTEQRYYDLSAIYYYAATGDKVNFVCFK